MPNFIVYVEFYGKKLKIDVQADNEFRADLEVRKRLRILKIEEKEIIIPDTNDDGLDFLKSIFNL